MMVIVGDAANHGDYEDCECYSMSNPLEGNRSYDSVWKDRFAEMRSIENLQVWFMPIRDRIRLTYNRFNSNLKDVHITEDTSGSGLKEVFDDTITKVYRDIIRGITGRHSPLCSNQGCHFYGVTA